MKFSPPVQDAVRNSIQAAAQACFSHKSLQGLNSGQLQDRLMLEKGINWNDYPHYQKRGSYLRVVKTSEPFILSPIEISGEHVRLPSGKTDYRVALSCFLNRFGYTAEERELLPEKHFARTNPNLVVKRRKMIHDEVPTLTTIVNRMEFLLYGETPVVNNSRSESESS